MASVSPPEDSDASILRRVATTGPGKSTWQFPERGLLFSSRFDGGNMASVQLTPSGSFDINLSEDAAAFGISTGYSTWFCFEERKIRVSFTYKFKFARERVRFAFCYPYTYTRVQEELAALDQQFTVPVELSLPGIGDTPTTLSKIYYHRELLTRSLEGLRVDLLTISSCDGIMPNRRSRQGSALQFDPKQKKLVVISARVHPGETPANFMLDGMLQLLLHPEDESSIALRRHFVFKIIPMLNPDGVCQGFYRTDTRGVNLNRVYEDPQPELAPSVFALKELLMDLVDEYGGVGSTSAQENVVYLDLHAHANRRGCFMFGNNHLPDLLDASNEAMEMAITRQVQTQMYARLVGLHTPFFDYMACLFDKESMTRRDLRDNNNATTSRQGSSRVALYRATGLTYVYTIECNYNEGRRNFRASSLISSSSSSANTEQPKRSSSLKGQARLPRQNAPTSGTRLYLKYSPAEWKDVGVGALIALLDLFELPGSGKRVEESPFRSRDGIRNNLRAEIRAATPGEGASKSGNMNKQRTRQIKIKKRWQGGPVSIETVDEAMAEINKRKLSISTHEKE
eukprot:jgi/Phyca11/6237/fgenesh1_pm.PHYCAscaffold_10_\